MKEHIGNRISLTSHLIVGQLIVSKKIEPNLKQTKWRCVKKSFAFDILFWYSLFYYRSSVCIWELTVRLTGFFTKTRRDIALQFAKSWWFEGFEIDFDFIRIRISQRRLSTLNDMNDTSQLITCELKIFKFNDPSESVNSSIVITWKFVYIQW